MKKFIRNFCSRGAMFAWGGPVILAIVWMCLKRADIIINLTVDEVVLGIISTTILAFIAAGISVLYQIENLPKSFAGLIQAAVLYIDYLGFYLLNGWIPLQKIWIFTVIFVVGFIIIWFSIYIPIRIEVNKMNKMIREENIK